MLTSTALKTKRPASRGHPAAPSGYSPSPTVTIGGYLAMRLEQVGIKHHFVVAGDYNLVLLDQLLGNKNIQQVYCCNELNCGFAARVRQPKHE